MKGPLPMRKALGAESWGAPIPFGPDGFSFTGIGRNRAFIIVSRCEFDGAEWVHASMSRHGSMPSYADLVHLHKAVFGDGWAYQVFSPPDSHINIHPHVLHLWGRDDGAPGLPDFGEGGSI